MEKRKLLIYTIVLSMITISTTNLFAKGKKSGGDLRKGKSTVTVGGGVSLAGAIISTFEKDVVASVNLTDPSVNAKTSSIPVLFGSYDYGISNLFSIGVAGSYESWKVTVPGYTDPYGSSTGGPITYGTSSLNISRVNIAIRPLFHFGSNENLDIYFGPRLGYTLWNTDVKSTDPAVTGVGFGHGNVFSPAVLFGTRYYFTPNIGLNFEISIGAPYAAALGVNFKF